MAYRLVDGCGETHGGTHRPVNQCDARKAPQSPPGVRQNSRLAGCYGLLPVEFHHCGADSVSPITCRLGPRVSTPSHPGALEPVVASPDAPACSAIHAQPAVQYAEPRSIASRVAWASHAAIQASAVGSVTPSPIKRFADRGSRRASSMRSGVDRRAMPKVCRASYHRAMSTVDHEGRHVWTRTSPRSARCAYMTCNARPSRADIERLAAQAAVARSLRTELDYATPARRLRD